MPPTTGALLDPSRVRAIRRALLRWFRASARPLPWRTSPRDPYGVWISEIMLQQTRVATVVPYYLRFMERFPNVQTLAAANLQQVLRLWSGLGYYQRARGVHRAARTIVDRHGGRVPSCPQLLRSLPGVGEYSAAAIASIAFGARLAVVDGNVQRVLARLCALTHDSSASRAHQQRVDLAQRLLPRTEPGTFNESVMELGATVCTPAAPGCHACPVHASCEALRRGLVESIPSPRNRPAPKATRLLAAVVTCGDFVLLAKRHAKGLFGALWEPPLFQWSTSAEAVLWLDGLGPTCRAAHVQHTLTHRALQIELLRVRAQHRAAIPPSLIGAWYGQHAWRAVGQLRTLGLSSLSCKLLAAAGVAAIDRR
jgi:A/G-specific adenine glycosylase